MKVDCGKVHFRAHCRLLTFIARAIGLTPTCPLERAPTLWMPSWRYCRRCLWVPLCRRRHWFFLPTWGTIDGDLWIREIAYNCQLVYKGTWEIGGAIASFYWVLVLPDRFIDALVQGEALDVSMFPQHQLNPCLTLQTSLSKCLHWCRQGVLQEQDTLSVLFWKPELSRAIGCMKTRSGTGGQLQLIYQCHLLRQYYW